MIQNKLLDLFVACPRHFEDVLFWELKNLGIKSKTSTAGVRCEATLQQAYEIILHTRIATRVLWNRLKFSVSKSDDLYQNARRINWPELFDVENDFVIHTQGQHQAFKNTMYAALLLKDAVVDDFRERLGSRPSISKTNANVHLHLSLQKKQVVISVDLTGHSLHQRGYRKHNVVAPIKEKLAAALLYKSKWPEIAEKGGSFVDLFSGSGTFVIEAALMAKNVAPGLFREDFSLRNLNNFDLVHWTQIREKAKRAVVDKVSNQFVACDIDGKAINAAQENAFDADVFDLIDFKQQPVIDWTQSDNSELVPGLVMSNPPYGERLSTDRVLYTETGQVICHQFVGWQVALLGSEQNLLKRLKLNRAEEFEFYNGRIETSMLSALVNQPSKESVVALNTKPVDGIDMFKNRVNKNYKHLKKWANRENIHAWRVYDADLPEFAVAVDIYENKESFNLVVQEYRAPKTIDWQLALERLTAVINCLPSLFNIPAEQVFLKHREKQKGSNQYEKKDRVSKEVIVEESALKFKTNLSDYLDTGLFLDHRKTRLEFAKLAKNKRVLNLFSYTSSVSVYAAAFGAKETISVDMSQTYLNWSRENFELNNLLAPQHQFIKADCLQWLEDEKQKPGHEKKRYDLIFLDPPTFSNSKNMEGHLDIQKDHQKMIFECMSILNAKGVLMFSSNYRRFKLSDKIRETFNVEDITAKTIPEDFKRRKNIHVCFLISKN